MFRCPFSIVPQILNRILFVKALEGAFNKDDGLVERGLPRALWNFCEGSLPAQVQSAPALLLLLPLTPGWVLPWAVLPVPVAGSLQFFKNGSVWIRHLSSISCEPLCSDWKTAAAAVHQLHETCYDWLRSIFGLEGRCTEFLPYRLPDVDSSLPGVLWLELQTIHRFSQSRRRTLLRPSPGWKRLHLQHYAMLKQGKWMWNWDTNAKVIRDGRVC